MDLVAHSWGWFLGIIDFKKKIIPLALFLIDQIFHFFPYSAFSEFSAVCLHRFCKSRLGVGGDHHSMINYYFDILILDSFSLHGCGYMVE